MIHPLTQVATKCIPRKFNSPNLKLFAFGGWFLFSSRTSRLKRPIAINTRLTLLKLSGNSYWTIGSFAVPVSQPLWWLNHNIFENSVRTEWITVRPRKPWALEISSECLLCYDQSQQRSYDTRTGHKTEDANIPSRDSSQDSCQDSTRGSTIFRFPAIFTSCKSHDH